MNNLKQSQMKLNFRESLSNILMFGISLLEYALNWCKKAPTTLFIWGGTTGIIYCFDQMVDVVTSLSCTIWLIAFFIITLIGCIGHYLKLIEDIRDNRKMRFRR